MFALGDLIKCVKETEGLVVGNEYEVVAPTLIVNAGVDIVWVQDDSGTKVWHACDVFGQVENEA